MQGRSELVVLLDALLGQCHLLDPPVVGVWPSLREAEGFEVVGEVGDVGGVAAHSLGGGTHRLGALEEVECVRLSGREAVGLGGLLEVGVHPSLDLEDSIEDLALGCRAHVEDCIDEQLTQSTVSGEWLRLRLR